MTTSLEQIERKVITIPKCLTSDCTGYYEDIFNSVMIECKDERHKAAAAVQGNESSRTHRKPLTSTGKNNDQKE